MNIHKTWKTIGWITVGSLSTFIFLHQYPDYLTKNLNIDNLNEKKPIISSQINKEINTDFKKFDDAINKSRKRLLQWKLEQCIPGMVVGVSIGGKNIWIEGQGLADIENNVSCNNNTVMRIASISKSLTATMLAKMIENNKINVDQSIYDYLDQEQQFPRKKWDNQYVDITIRQLAAHLGGIRHYNKNDDDDDSDNKSETDRSEYYIKDYYPTVTKSLELFKNDPLVAKPGTKFHYSTYGYTLLSAVIESQLESKNFAKEFVDFIQNELGLRNTCLDKNDRIISNRSRYYCRDRKTGVIRNCSYVDNSYKWAGGGLLSNVPDLLKYGNLMLYSYIGVDHMGRIGFLKKSIVEEMWKPVENSSTNWSKNQSKGYGMGFSVIHNGHKNCHAYASEPIFDNVALHSGGAIGASSILVIEPSNEIVVAIIVNLQDANGITNIGLEVAKIFSSTNIEK